MNSRHLALILPSLALGSTGCAAWMTTQTETAVSSQPAAIFTQKVDFGVAMGSSGSRVYTEVGAGLGYRVANDAPHADLHVQLGYENGAAVRWGVGLVGSGRFGPDVYVPTADPTVLEHVDTDAGGGVAGHLFVRVPPDSPQATGLYFGVAGSAEILSQGSEDNPRVHFLGTAGPALRYVFDDTTEPKFRL